jgi:hypothetical protein
LGVEPGLEPCDHALAFEPLNAAFKAPKINVVGSLIGTMLRYCRRGLAIGRRRRSKMICVSLEDIKQITQWGHHGPTPGCRPP